MGFAYLYNSGSSGNPLAYDIICQNEEPSKKEGRIWIDSSTPMVSFQFAPAWTTTTAGEISIPAQIGGDEPSSTNSTISVINSKINGIAHTEKITPLGCQQSQSDGSWVDVPAYVCHNDTWVEFTTYYLLNGTNKCENNTGGWETTDYGTYNNAYKYLAATDSSDGNYITLSFTKNTTCRGWYKTKNMVNYPGAKTISIEYSGHKYANTNGQGVWLAVSSDSAGTNPATSVASVILNNTTGERTTATLDVSSLTFPLYIRVGALLVGDSADINIYKVWVK